MAIMMTSPPFVSGSQDEPLASARGNDPDNIFSFFFDLDGLEAFLFKIPARQAVGLNAMNADLDEESCSLSLGINC